MHIPLSLTAIAPQATGHPLSLPRDPHPPPPGTRVSPLRAAPDTSLQAQTPETFWRRMSGLPDPETHVAPPSIMQIRIEQMLQDFLHTNDTPPDDIAAAPDSGTYGDARMDAGSSTLDERA